ncbi:hypothetical protein [Nocardiopsis dassonvillei]|uniref:hypothetical protein n=1 Tax=Nocardiopsis dassonvillei TaxID=2014 RepID=UPI00157BC3DD|nr:hypothetical protein [Nocardiopsis dassonvillei]
MEYTPEQIAQLIADRDRYKAAWTNARTRAAEYKRLNGVHHYLMESYGRQGQQHKADLRAVRREAHLMASGGTSADYVRGVVAAREALIEAADASDVHTDERMLRASLELTRAAIEPTDNA